MVNLSEAKKRIEFLVKEINRHNHLYYVLDKPILSDSEYDKLFKELVDLETNHTELIRFDSPSQRVGGRPLDFFPKYQHRVPLLSLESLFKPEDVEAFDKRIKKDVGIDNPIYVVEPKLDGLSVVVVYKNGVYSLAATRGDGSLGEEVTQNVKTIKSLPLTLMASNIPTEMHLRGEVIMTTDGFEQYNKKLIERGDEPFANPRNAASGAIRQLNPKVTAERPLDIYLYDLLYADTWHPKTHWEVLESLQKWGIKVNPYKRECSSVQAIMDFHAELERMRDDLDFEIDGIVVKLNDRSLQESLGFRARSPRWALALKFEPRKETTRLDDIVLQVGRQGTLTPVALLKPVDVSGVTVSRASLHNLDIIQKLDVRVGDEVGVARAGDVIPEVVEVNYSKRKEISKQFEMPITCPVCGAQVTREGAFYFCTGGYSCPAQLKWSIIHFVSKGAMDIEGLGKESAELLIEKGLIKNAAGLYALKKEDLLQLEGFKDKKAENIITGIEASKRRSLSRFLYALGIRHVGEEVAKLLSDHFGSLDHMAKASLDEIQAIDGVGPQIADSLQNYFQSVKNQNLIKLFQERGVCPIEEQRQKIVGPLFGKIFVLTGELKSLSRIDAKKKIESLGGKVSGSVSKKTNYVVVGSSPGSKHDKAVKLDVAILNESEFLKFIS